MSDGQWRRGSAWQAALAALAAVALVAGCKPPASPPTSPPATPPPAEMPGQPQHLATAEIMIGGVSLKVEVASTPEQQSTGMMFRPMLGPDEAMLFVFNRDSNLSFWMKNTYVDLDLAYIRSDGLILQLERLKAHDPTAVYSRRPARYALEVPPGWFAAHKVDVGSRVSISREVMALVPGN